MGGAWGLADLAAVVVVTGEHDRGWFEQSRRVRCRQTHCSVTNHQHGVSGLKVRTEYRMVASWRVRRAMEGSISLCNDCHNFEWVDDGMCRLDLPRGVGATFTEEWRD
jgi:hypothetical protein